MKLEQLNKDFYYHIYNRGIDSCKIFKNEGNKAYFLKLLGKYLNDSIHIIAFCLMDNHFHLVVKVVSQEKVSQSFSNFFNAYAKAFNKQQNRTGSLFQKIYKRKLITTEDYLKNVILYVHNNPMAEAESYKYSSYHYYLNKLNPVGFQLQNEEIIRLFETVENFKFVQRNYENNIDLQGF